MADDYAQGLVGITLDGRYRLDAVLGEGGMGSVFRATQLAMDRKVAVKLLKPHLTSDQAALERFAREARATLKVDSPHAVKILDFGVTPLRDYYMVLEYLDGRTVQRELEIDGAFAPARVVHIARQALAALAAAHDQALIHRDVKPDNLLLMRVSSDPDFTKILDFGVAKLMQGADAALALTGAGMVFGTPEYMSPEQACGQPLDGRSDLYSLAVTMFVMLTGMPLFEADAAIEWLTHHARTPAPRLAMVRPALAAYPALDDLLQRCLSKHRAQRPASAGEMSALLGALEPSLGPGMAGATRMIASAGPQRTPTRVSSFFPMLRESSDTSAPVPGAPMPAAPMPGAPMSSRPPRLPMHARSASPVAANLSAPRRRMWPWLAGATAAALVGVVAGFAILGSAAPDRPSNTLATAPASSPPSEPPSQPTPAQSTTSVAPPATGATSTPTAPSTSATPPATLAAGSSAPTAPTAPIATSPASLAPHGLASQQTAAREHLHNAEEALHTNNRLRQLAEADLALQADPRNARAQYLLADALIKGGDINRGCAYLHALTHYGPAHQRARDAGCPGD